MALRLSSRVLERSPARRRDRPRQTCKVTVTSQQQANHGALVLRRATAAALMANPGCQEDSAAVNSARRLSRQRPTAPPRQLSPPHPSWTSPPDQATITHGVTSRQQYRAPCHRGRARHPRAPCSPLALLPSSRPPLGAAAGGAEARRRRAGALRPALGPTRRVGAGADPRDPARTSDHRSLAVSQTLRSRAAQQALTGPRAQARPVAGNPAAKLQRASPGRQRGCR
jgi:hypothetical protein